MCVCVKSFPSQLAIVRRWYPILWHQPKLQDHEHGASVSHGVPVYPPVYSGTKLYCIIRKANVCERVARCRTRRRKLNPWYPIASPAPRRRRHVVGLINGKTRPVVILQVASADLREHGTCIRCWPRWDELSCCRHATEFHWIAAPTCDVFLHAHNDNNNNNNNNNNITTIFIVLSYKYKRTFFCDM